MDYVRLVRYKFTDRQTLGIMYCCDELTGEEIEFDTLELPWKNNQTSISCIPQGRYHVAPRTSKKFKKHFHIKDVEGRKWILIHYGNFYTEIRGCILIGDGLSDINSDGYQDVLNSRDSMSRLLELYPKGFKLIIEDKCM